MKLSEMKFDTRGNEEVSKWIQEQLFKLRYSWVRGHVYVPYRYFIYANEDGSLTYSEEHERRGFELTEHEEIDLKPVFYKVMYGGTLDDI